MRNTNSRFLGLVYVGRHDRLMITTALRPFCHKNDVKRITYMQSVLAKRMEMYTDIHTQESEHVVKNVMASFRF